MDEENTDEQTTQSVGVNRPALLAENLTCDDCGVTSSKVKRGNCLFAEDANGESAIVNLCPSCYHERCMDI